MAGSVAWPLLGVLFVYFLLRTKSHPALKRIPYIKYKAYLPDIFNRLIYYPKASSMIYRGYEKVRSSTFVRVTATHIDQKYSTRTAHFEF